MVTSLSMRQWCAWHRIFPCAIPSCGGRETLAQWMAIAQRPTAIQKQSLLQLRRKCSVILKKIPWTLFQTLMVCIKSQPSCQQLCHNFFSMAQWVSLLGWQQIFRHTICASLHKQLRNSLTIHMQPLMNLCVLCQVQTFQRAELFTTRKKFAKYTPRGKGKSQHGQK